MGPTLIGVRLHQGAVLLNGLCFSVSTAIELYDSTFQLRELREINSLVVRESNCELFEMNYSQFEGMLNDLGNCGLLPFLNLATENIWIEALLFIKTFCLLTM